MSERDLVCIVGGVLGALVVLAQFILWRKAEHAVTYWENWARTYESRWTDCRREIANTWERASREFERESNEFRDKHINHLESLVESLQEAVAARDAARKEG